MGIVTRIMQQYPDIEQSFIEGLVRRGYTENEIRDMLDALEENANNAGYPLGDPRRTRSINVALAAIIRRFNDRLNNEPYVTLLDIGYIQSEIRNILFTNLMPMTQLLFRTAAAHASGGYDRLYLLGYTDVEIRSFIRTGFTVSQLRALADRIKDAERNGVDAQGLTVEQINDMLFKERPINGGTIKCQKIPLLFFPPHTFRAMNTIAGCIS